MTVVHPTATVVHPIARAWISTGGTGARNYDEFADETEITRIIGAQPDSALAIEMPHRAPQSLSKSFRDALPDAVARLSAQRSAGSYAPADDVIALYQISEPGRPDDAGYGIFAMVDTDQISTRAGEPGLVIRNEDVFIEKVRERVALAEATGFLLSPVLLCATGRGEDLHGAIASVVATAGAPMVTDIDHAGRTHAIWAIPGHDGPGTRLRELASSGELVVADGNHRSLAAQTGGLTRFLAVITTTRSVNIQPYHRLLAKTPLGVAELATRLIELGASVRPCAGQVDIPAPGEIILYGRQSGDGPRGDGPGGDGLGGGRPQALVVELAGCADATDSHVDSMDHALVERVVLRDGLGLEPGDKRITYVGGDYPPQWLVGEVDAGRADLAILVAPVSVDDFVAVNLARQKLPRKSTWFTPKARAGLVLAELAAEAKRAPSIGLIDED